MVGLCSWADLRALLISRVLIILMMGLDGPLIN
jgi:hypothetical protein